MNPSQYAEQFQSQLANYVPQFTPEFWPVWLIIAGVLLVGMWLVLGLHALLRARGVKKSATDHGEKVYLYSKAVRLWHWSNALLFVLLLASGLINHFAMVGATAVKSLVAVHEVCGFLLLACWLGFVLINAVGDNGHHYRIRRQGWLERAAKQTRFYLFGIMQGEEHPFPATTQSKFNPLQQVALCWCHVWIAAVVTIDGAAVSLSASRGRCVSWRKILVIAGAFCSGIYKPLFYLRSSLSLHHGAYATRNL